MIRTYRHGKCFLTGHELRSNRNCGSERESPSLRNIATAIACLPPLHRLIGAQMRPFVLQPAGHLFSRRTDFHRPGSRSPTQSCLVAQASDAGDLSTEFARFVNTAGVKAPSQARAPSPLMSPSAVVEAQMDALQRNDYPDVNAGVHAAYAFSMQYGNSAPKKSKPPRSTETEPRDDLPSTSGLARSWEAAEKWLSFQDFSVQLHSPPYNIMLNCDSWQPASQLKFTAGFRAVQAVQVTAPKPRVQQFASDNSSTRSLETKQHDSNAHTEAGMRKQVFTFCLELVEKPGPYKACWLTVGVRQGDYVNV